MSTVREGHDTELALLDQRLLVDPADDTAKRRRGDVLAAIKALPVEPDDAEAEAPEAAVAPVAENAMRPKAKPRSRSRK